MKARKICPKLNRKNVRVTSRQKVFITAVKLQVYILTVFSLVLRGKSILFHLQIIRSGAEGNREGVLQKSIEMKFLTGYESKVSMAAATIQVKYIQKNIW